MSRRFTRASSHAIGQTLSAPGFTGLTFGSVAVVTNRTSSGSGFHSLCALPNAGNSDSSLAMALTSLDLHDFYYNTFDSISTFTVTNTTGWALIVGTKATGSVTPRLHCYKWSTNAWTHENAGSALANASSFHTAWQIGGDSPNSDWYDGDIAAVMVLDKRVLSDGECERLPRGLWEQWATGPTDYLREFAPSERIVTGTATERNIDASRLKDVSTTGTARTPIADPPGFRFSAKNRRQ